MVFVWPSGSKVQGSGQGGSPSLDCLFLSQICWLLWWLLVLLLVMTDVDICWRNCLSRLILQPAVQCLETKMVIHITSIPIQPNLPEMRMGDNSENLLPWDRLRSSWPKSTQLWSTWLWFTWPWSTLPQSTRSFYSIYAFFLYSYNLNCPAR